MKKRLQNLVMVAILLIAANLIPTQNVKATHAMGAEITYKCLGNNKYLFTYQSYFDCSSALNMYAQFPTIPFNIHSTSCGFDSTFTMTLDSALSGVEITPVCPTMQTQCTNVNSIYPISK